MSNIHPIFSNESLDPRLLKTLGTAFDSAERILGKSNPLSESERDALASVLLALAAAGRGVDDIAMKAVAVFGQRAAKFG